MKEDLVAMVEQFIDRRLINTKKEITKEYLEDFKKLMLREVRKFVTTNAKSILAEQKRNGRKEDCLIKLPPKAVSKFGGSNINTGTCQMTPEDSARADMDNGVSPFGGE